MAGLGTFRAKALLKLQSPDQLDDRVQVVNRWTWLALLGLGAIVSGVVVWATVATLPTSVAGAGYVVPQAGWTGVQATATGVVKSVVGVNDKISAGQTLAVIIDQSNSHEVTVAAVSSGVIAESNATVGQYVQAGDQLAIMAPSKSDLVVYAYFPVNSARSIAPNASTDVSLDGTPTAAFGYIRGRVDSVAALPATSERLQQVLLNSALAAQVSKHGPVVEVVVTLERAQTPSGYDWTLGHGPGFNSVSGGVPAHVSIVVTRKHPISFVF